MRLGRRKRKMRALASERSRRVELVGNVGGVGDGQVFVDELWDIRAGEDDGPLVEDAVIDVDRYLGGVAPSVGPLGDSMGADQIRIYGVREPEQVRIVRAIVHPRLPLSRKGRRELKKVVARLKESLTE